MSDRILLVLNEVPGVIRESARCVLAAHGFIVTDRAGNPIGPRETESLLNELGRNAAQALLSIDENDLDGEPMPEGSSDPLPLHVVSRALVLVLSSVAQQSERPAELLENAIAMIAQDPACEGRELPTLITEKVFAMSVALDAERGVVRQ